MNPSAWINDGPPTGGESPWWVALALLAFYVIGIWAVVSGPLRAWADEKEWRAPALLYGVPFVLLAVFLLVQ